MAAPRKNAGIARGRPFKAGNPGRPHGTRHRTTLAVEVLLDGEAEALTRKAIEAALGGDVTAMRICLDRIAPPRRERTISFTAPTVGKASDVPQALAAIIHAVVNGEITPGEGTAMAGLLDRYRGAFELVEIEARIAALEAKNQDGAQQ